jgi:hypothetical protein
MPDRGTVHISQPLSNVAAGFKQAGHIWNGIMPIVPVDKETDSYYEFGREFLRYHGKVRANGAPAQEVNSYSAAEKTYECVEHSYKDIVTDRDRSKADPIINPDVRVTNNLTKIVDLDLEVGAASTLFNAANFVGMTAAPTNKWDVSVVDGDPVTDVDTAVRAVQKEIGVKPNTMVIGAQVFDVLKRHPDLLEMFKYTGKGILTLEMLQQAFNIEKILVGDAIYINSKAGQSTVTTDYIWGKSCAILYTPANPAMEEPAWGYTFMHKLFGGVTARVKKWRDENRGGDMIEVSRSFSQKVTGQKAGYLYTAVIG